MKKLLFSIFTFFVLSACSVHAQNKKIAVITFYAVKQVGITELGSAAVLAEKLANDPSFNVEPLLKKFHDQFFDNYAKQFSFDLLPEEQIINNEAYKAFVPIGLGTTTYANTYNAPYPGYKVIVPLAGHENERAALKIFNQADGVMKVYIDFDLVKIGFAGMGVVKINAHANMALFNKDGDQVFSLKEDAKSKNTSPMVAGLPVMSVEKILPMCESAMEELMSSLQKDMPKMVKKANSKL